MPKLMFPLDAEAYADLPYAAPIQTEAESHCAFSSCPLKSISSFFCPGSTFAFAFGAALLQDEPPACALLALACSISASTSSQISFMRFASSTSH